MVAFEKFKDIDSLPTVEEKHRAWLRDYHGLQYSIAANKIHQIMWMKQPKYYDIDKHNPMTNCIARKKDRLIIEFDSVEGEPNNAKESLEKVMTKLKEYNFGFIRSTHGSKNSDYLWVEFTQQLSSQQAKRFLSWICPDGSRIDTNFCSDKKLFPVLYAYHWKYSQVREMPIDFYEGEKIDFSKLPIPSTTKKETITLDADGYAYATIQAAKIFTPKGQAEVFTKAQPIFYDKAGLFWLWNPQSYCWETVDEIEILNMIESATGQDVITPKNRTLILNSLKQKGRKMIPESIKPTWIQFKDTIVDILTGESFKASPKYFVTNPIPYILGETPETPVMDRIFEEWVGLDNKELLYEILAYCLLSDMPIHRIFCFIGGGMNGKSKFLELLRKFVGEKNCCSTELDVLLSSRFEVTRLHKKLVCQMGETNFNEMSKTSLLKKLSGGDLIGYEYKNKNPFEEKNYAKIIIATNNLPTTTDKTVGFYRRWTIIDFPNQFSEKKDILAEIPESEYNSLALRCTVVLRSLLERREFTNEGSIEERMERYESKSNFLHKFIKEYTLEDLNEHISFAAFKKRFSDWCKENKHREMSDASIGLAIKKLGIEKEKKYFNWMYDGKGGQAWCLMGIKWKE